MESFTVCIDEETIELHNYYMSLLVEDGDRLAPIKSTIEIPQCHKETVNYIVEALQFFGHCEIFYRKSLKTPHSEFYTFKTSGSSLKANAGASRILDRTILSIS